MSNLSKPSIVFVCDGVNAPAPRFRVKPVAQKLEEHGWDCKIIYRYGSIDSKIKNKFLQKLYRTFGKVFNAFRTLFISHTDVVVFQRLSLPWISVFERFIANRGIPVVFDFDDAIFLDSKGRFLSSRNSALKKIFACSSITIAGNSWLAQKSKKLAETIVIPTCIDTKKYYPFQSSEEKSQIVIGWMGTSSNYDSLRLIVRVIQQLRERNDAFTFKVVSDLKDEQLIAKLDADFEYWSEEKELSQLQSFDIGLMPLQDTNWSKGKCSFKIIQYMAVGIPSVASDIGFNRDVVSHAMDGFLVTAENDWYRSLSKLLEDKKLRNQMGKKARQKAVEKFRIEIAADKYDKLLKSII